MQPQRARLAAIQPAAPSDPDEHPAMVEAAWRLATKAADRGADLIVLPEYLNVMGFGHDGVRRRARMATEVVGRALEFCRRTRTWLLLPVVEYRGGSYYNAAHLISSGGDIALTYDKTHLTITERRDLGLTPGQSLPVVDTPLGRVGVMTCYDVYFPEVARALSLQRCDAILFPSLQRSDTPERCMLLSRVRAMDSACHLVRASYGLRPGERYEPGKVYGCSCVIAPDGTVMADAGQYEGVAVADVDLRAPWVRNRCSGADPEPVRDFLIEDRRPELYGPVVGEMPLPSLDDDQSRGGR